MISDLEIIRMWCNEDGHDKVYGAYYNKATRTILGVWGRRGSALSSQPKKNKSYGDFLKLVDGKKKKGYCEIDDIGGDEIEIRLSLDEIANSFVDFGGVLAQSVGELEDVEPTSEWEALEKDAIVVCVDNSGLAYFEVGLSYLFKGVATDTIILVENMLGEEDQVLMDRFKVVEKEIA